MIFESALSIGEIGWCVSKSEDIRKPYVCIPLTIGLIRVEKIDSPGAGDLTFDNYKAQSGYKEEYMCVETGIRSGSLYTLGRNIFKTEKEAVKAADDCNKKFLGRKKDTLVISGVSF